MRSAFHLADETHLTDAALVLRFWFGEGNEYGTRLKRWFDKDAAFDARCRDFLPLYEALAAGAARPWPDGRAEWLARILVLDQLPRNMFRGTPRAFAADAIALQAAHHVVERKLDRELLPVQKLFAYLPFEHSERLEDQRLACELTRPLEAFPETNDAHRYAVAHCAIIERFGRFPHRNAILGRPSTPEELAFLSEPGSSF